MRPAFDEGRASERDLRENVKPLSFVARELSNTHFREAK